jgi:ABC-type polysaccharide/polyol phosphate export permease
VLQIGLFVTPVLYPISLVHTRFLQLLLYVNPVAGVVEGFRWSLIGTPPPGLPGLVSFASALLVLLTGVIYFGRIQRRIADII